MMTRPLARLLQPAHQKQKPLTRAEAERKLAKVLGKGNKDLYAQYVRKRTQTLSISELRLLERSFAKGDRYDFERTFDQLFLKRVHPDRRSDAYRVRPMLYDDDLEMVKFE